MHKIIMIFNLLLSVVNNKYANIDQIELYNSYKKQIEFVFYFSSDYLNYHEMEVVIEIFNNEDKKLINYSNNITFIGEKRAVAKLDYLYLSNMYAHISVTYEGEKILSNIRFNFFETNDCELNSENRLCNEMYKTVYNDGLIKNHFMDFEILTLPFDKFLFFNKLDISNTYIHSNYDFSDAEVYLLIENKIEEYDLVYENGYKIPLNVLKNEERYNFSVMEKYYLSIEPFIFSENYNENLVDVKYVFFPFLGEYKTYDCKLIIDGINLITIDFFVSTSEKLFGECDDSKYCIKRVNYD